MFDWPLQNQTSPAMTFSRTVFCPSSNVSVYGPPALGTERSKLKAPVCRSACALRVWPSHDAVIFTVAPFLAVAERWTVVCCCRTMLLVIHPGRRTSAPAEAAKLNAKRKIAFFISSSIYGINV